MPKSTPGTDDFPARFPTVRDVHFQAVGGSMAAIEVLGLTKTFGDVKAVDDLSFSVDPGTITGFVGPNGAGKSTTLRAILGLVQPDSGRALISGVPYRRLPNPPATVGAVLETGAFHP